MSNININPNDNPTRRQSSLGGNVRFRDAGNVEGNYGIFLAYVTHVYYQEGTLDFDARDTIENLVDVGLGKGLGQAPIPVETFGTNSDGKVYGQYRPINVGDKVAIAYLNGSRRTPIVIGVYPKNSSSYELVSPVPFNMKNESDDEAEVTTLSDKKIYPSQQVFYQSGKGDIFRSLGGHSFMTLNEDQMDFTKDLDYAYDAISAFYDNNGEQLNPQEDKAQAWLLVHEDNPDSNSADGHRTRFYVAKDGEVQLVFTNSNNPGILILQGSLDKGLTIKKQYDTSVIDDDSSNEYVALNIGGESGFSLDVHNVSGNNLTRSAKNSTNFAVKSDDVYVNNVSLTDLIGENADDIQQIIDNNQKYNQEYFDKLDKSTKEAGQIARNAARDAHEAGAHAHDAGEQAKATSKDIKDRIMYYMNISPEEDVYVPNKYLIIHTDTFIEDATIKQGMIDDLAVGTAQIAYEAVGTAEIEDLAVSSAKIDNLAVTDEKVGHLTFDHMIGEQIDANTIDVVNLHGDNITAGTITANKILINGLGDLSHHLGDITDGHIQSGDNGVIIDDLPADDPDQWTPAKKALLKQQIGILEAEANATIQYGDNVGITSDTIENAKNALINGTASLLTNMTTTEKFSNSQIQTWISDLKNAVEDFRNEANDTLIKKVGTTESGNNIYQGPEEPDPANVHLGDIWFKEYEKDGKTTYEQLVYGNDGWYSPSDYNITQIQEQLDKLPTPYYQADEPQGDIKKDDTWYKTSTDSNGNINYTAYKYDGYDWQPMLDNNVNKNTSGTSAPANPRPGDQWYDETTKELKQLNDQGTDWIVIPTQGPQGVPGADGKSSYTHIAYATSSTGSGFTQTPTSSTTYMGVYVNQIATDSTNPADYRWSLIKGADGAQGTPGKAGADGKTPYFHIAYADNATGTTGFSTTDSLNKSYIGQYTDFVQADSTDPTSYAWTLIKGDKGDKGSDGLPGKDGVGIATTVVTYQASTSGTTVPSGTWSISVPSVSKGQYLWTRTVWTYTDKSSEVGYSVAYIAKDGNDGTNGVAGKDGVGIKSTTITYAQSTSGTVAPTTGYTVTVPSVPEGQFLWTKTVWTYTDGTNETGYSVGKIGEKGDTGAQGLQGLQGPQGDQGIQGPKGLDGKTYYTWIKYATSDSGANMSDNPEGMDYIGLAYNKDSADESSVATDYTWSLFKGPQGDQGVPGADGKDGKPSYTWIKYADSPTSGMSDSPDGKQYMGIVTNKDTATESSNYSDYTWSLINDNSKKRNFVDTPTTPYDVGDTWTQSGATLYCIKARQSGAFSASDWNTQQITLTSLDTALQQQVQDGTDAKDGLDNLSYENRNLVLSSADNSHIGITDNRYKVFKLSVDEMDSKIFTVSTYLKDIENTDGISIGLSMANANDGLRCVDADIVQIGSNYYASGVIDLSGLSNYKDYNYMIIYSGKGNWAGSDGKAITSYNRQVEKGTKATDWSPAPEDLVSQNKDYKGVTINENGLTADAGYTQVALNSSDGFLIKKGSSTLFNADTSGNLNMQGNITAGNISGVNFTGNNLTLAGSLKTTGSLSSGNGKVTLSNTGLNIKGAGLTIGDSSGTTTTMISDDGTFTANKAVLSGSLTSNSVNITGGTINMNGGAFSVDRSGNVVAKHFTATGTDGAINAGLINQGTLDFNNITAKNLKADNIQGGTLTGVVIQGNTIKAGADDTSIILDNNGFIEAKSNAKFNMVYDSEFNNGAETWILDKSAYNTNLTPYIDGSNRMGFNSTISVSYLAVAKSNMQKVIKNSKYSASCSGMYFNDADFSLTAFCATMCFFDSSFNRIKNYDMWFDISASKNNVMQYVKTENVTPPSDASYVAMWLQVFGPGGGHVVWTQPYITPYETVGNYVPDYVSGNNTIAIKDGYINLPMDNSRTLPRVWLNYGGAQGESFGTDGRGTLSGNGLFINDQVHEYQSWKTLYSESLTVKPQEVASVTIDNYNNNKVYKAGISGGYGLQASQSDPSNTNNNHSTNILPNMITMDASIISNNDVKNLGFTNYAGTSLYIAYDGRPFIYSKDIYNRTYSDGANVYVTGYGTLGRSTSASKYKVNISSLYNISNKAHQFLAVQPKQWYDKSEMETISDNLSCKNRENADISTASTYPHAGFIAEDLEKAGLEEFVTRGEDNDLEGIDYDKLPVLHHQLLREAYNRIDYLETQLKLIKNKLNI